MSLSLIEIETEARKLPLEERARLIGVLIASLESADEGDIEAAWEQELLARSKEVQDGSVNPVPADEALERVRRSLT
ncbi:MAG TPA: addiction module protein [Candidatus Angelobacter sp.]|nr:addiction module protein [Candidatus Angelobacter sp.]